jgi:hypothetical protein
MQIPLKIRRKTLENSKIFKLFFFSSYKCLPQTRPEEKEQNDSLSPGPRRRHRRPPLHCRHIPETLAEKIMKHEP